VTQDKGENQGGAAGRWERGVESGIYEVRCGSSWVKVGGGLFRSLFEVLADGDSRKGRSFSFLR